MAEDCRVPAAFSLIGPSGGTLYAGVAEWVVDCIDKGIYGIGDKLPSIRALKATLGVSVNTVREAYDLLERRRFVECRPQSGYFVRKKAAPPYEAPPARDFASISRTVPLCRAQGLLAGRGGSPRAGEMLVASPSPDLLPTSRLRAAYRAALGDLDSQALDHWIAPGHGPLREEIARFSVDAGAQLSPEDIIVTGGCSEAVFLALMAACRTGDAVAVESPTYFMYLETLRELGMEVLEIPSSPTEGMSLEALRFALAHHRIAACLSAPTFSNPLGSTIPGARKRELVAILEEAGVPLIEDDVSGCLQFAGPRPPACKAFDSSGNVLYCSSFTQVLGAGLRVGWIAAGRFADKVLRLKAAMNVGAPSLEQAAVCRFLADGHCERHLRSFRAAIDARMSAMAELVRESFPEGSSVTRPSGGFLLWVGLPRGILALELFELCAKEGILFAPGPRFSASGRFDNCLRLNGSLSGEGTERSVRRIGELAASL